MYDYTDRAKCEALATMPVEQKMLILQKVIFFFIYVLIFFYDIITMNEFVFNIGLFVLRVGFGCMMVVHGFQKLKIIISGGASSWLNPIGIGSSSSLYLATFAELFCSLALVLGIFTRVSSFILAFTMFIAAFVFLKSSAWVDKELAVLFLIGFLALIFLGGGDYSISSYCFTDGSFFRKL